MKIAVNGLKLEVYVVDSVSYNHRDSIVEAAYEVLRIWQMQQTDSTSAYTNLAIALQECGMNHLAAELKSYGKPAVESVPLVKSKCNGCLP